MLELGLILVFGYIVYFLYLFAKAFLIPDSVPNRLSGEQRSIPVGSIALAGSAFFFITGHSVIGIILLVIALFISLSR